MYSSAMQYSTLYCNTFLCITVTTKPQHYTLLHMILANYNCRLYRTSPHWATPEKFVFKSVMNFEKFVHKIFLNSYLCSHVCSQCHQSSSSAFSEWLPKQWCRVQAPRFESRSRLHSGLDSGGVESRISLDSGISLTLLLWQKSSWFEDLPFFCHQTRQSGP